MPRRASSTTALKPPLANTECKRAFSWRRRGARTTWRAIARLLYLHSLCSNTLKFNAVVVLEDSLSKAQVVQNDVLRAIVGRRKPNSVAHVYAQNNLFWLNQIHRLRGEVQLAHEIA